MASGEHRYHPPKTLVFSSVVVRDCRRLILAVLAAGVATNPLQAAPRSGASVQAVPLPVQPAVATGSGPLALSLRRSAGAVEVVIEGTGAAPVLQQGASASGGWAGQLRTATPSGLRLGPQRFSLPEAGLQSVSFQGSGNTFQVQVEPMPGAPLGRPVVSADGRNLVISFAVSPQTMPQSARLDLRVPGAVPQPGYVPPLRPRAVAPPLGDMAVGTMTLRNRDYLDLSGPPITMNLRNAPAREVLLSLARAGGYGLAYVEEFLKSVSDITSDSSGFGVDTDAQVGPGSVSASTNGGSRGERKESTKIEQQILEPPPVTLSFVNEPFSRAFNTVLLVAGLQGRREPGSNTLFVGSNIAGKMLGARVSKIYRLNQASAASAADYLASLGAQITKVNVITNSVTQGASQASQVSGSQASQTTQTQAVAKIEAYGATSGPLKGLAGTTDSRLQTITLVGEPPLVSIAENYLRQIDLRQRQVALSVRILDVSLNNGSSISNSFAFRYGNSFIVNDDGSFAGAWGRYLPPAANLTADAVVGPVASPGMQYPKNEFFDVLKASIESQSTKLLASPTLIISENPEEIVGGASVTPAASSGTGGAASQAFQSASIGRERANESFVTVGTQVITDYTVTNGTQGNGNSCEPEFSTAGLTFGARVNKIDDNGFVTFSLSPAVSAITDQQDVEGCGPINILSVRRLDTGSVRVRDGQTLILTGVISDFNSQGVTKIPLLGDLPLIGQFFRSSSGSRTKNELVILVTPRIINDAEGGTYGYGYQPATPDSRQLMAVPAGATGF